MSTVSINISGLSELTNRIENMRKSLKSKADIFVKRLAEIGEVTASRVYASAEYAGNTNVTMDIQPIDTGYELSANGTAILFIEFGTGISYPEVTEKKPPEIVAHGEYGKGNGRRQGWAYPLENGLGTTGKELKKKDGSPTGYAFTRGNPPARGMYQAREEIIREMKRIANEVFNSD